MAWNTQHDPMQKIQHHFQATALANINPPTYSSSACSIFSIAHGCKLQFLGYQLIGKHKEQRNSTVFVNAEKVSRPRKKNILYLDIIGAQCCKNPWYGDLCNKLFFV